MRYRLRTLLSQFSIRDLLWLTLVVAALTAWWDTRRENATIRDDYLAKMGAVKAESQALQVAAAKKEAILHKEVQLLDQLAQNQKAELAKRDAELRDSLERREAVMNALRTLKDAPPSN